MPVIPQAGGCAACGGGGAGTAGTHDVEDNLLCDVAADGTVLGTALAVYDYDNTTGLPVGPPTFRDPVTGAPYVPQGILQPCPGAASCGTPQRFCFESSTTADVPGRQYDLTLNMGIGFAVTGVIKDLTVASTSVLWNINDPAGTQFASDLQAAVQSQFAGGTVTVTPGVIDECSGVGAFAIHIECFRLDQTPPTLVQLQYNGGRDLIQNPAFVTPTLGVTRSGFGKRTDAVSPVATANVDCTNVAGLGWQTNDKVQSFEEWGVPGAPGSTASFYGVTPTPRGTPVQEINSFGSGPTPTAGTQAGDPNYGQNPNTIWQVFTVPAAGNFTIRVVVGGRSQVNNIPIKLSTGNVGDAGIGDVLNTSVNAGNVDNEGPGQGAWTTFNQTVPLAAGTYTLAFTGPNAPLQGPGSANSFGGLFTDMRVFQDAPGTVSNFVNDDDTCTVSVTTQDTTCSFWAPTCNNGTIGGWTRLEDGVHLTNAAFWAQVPAPQCCEILADASGGGNAALGNLVHTYLVCGNTDTGVRTLSRVVITDQNGAAISEQFVDTTGALVTPSSWQPGQCDPANANAYSLGPVCYVDAVPAGNRFGFQTLENGVPVLRDLSGNVVTGATIVICPEQTVEHQILCDFGNANHQFLRWYLESPIVGQNDVVYDLELDGSTAYVPVGPVGVCFAGVLRTADSEVLCDDNGPFLRTYTYDANGLTLGRVDTLLNGTTPYVEVGTVVNCQPASPVVDNGFDIAVEVLCDNAGARFLRKYEYDADAGTVAAVTDTLLDGITAFAPVAPVTNCQTAPVTITTRDEEVVVLCDSTPTTFLRKFNYDGQTGAFIGFVDTTLAGVAFAPVGAVGTCQPAVTVLAENDVELLVLCDSAAVPNRFLRRYVYDSETPGAPTVTNTALDGVTPFVPTGAVQVCPQVVATDLDFVVIELCDNNGGFLRRLTFNSTTGAVTATTDTTLAGAAYATVGTVGICDGCCTIEVGEFCTNTGSGLGTAIRLPNGTISLVDSLTGAAITAANKVTCPAANGNNPTTVAADHFSATPGTPWTPAAIPAGRRLVSLTYTVLSGTATVTDANGATVVAAIPAGYTATWSVNDDRETLTPPASIASVGGSVLVLMATAL